MTSKTGNKLDNPVWFSLTENHRNFGIGYPSAKFYHPDFCPFGGLQKTGDVAAAIDAYAILAGNFFIVGERPGLSPRLKITKEVICLQMVIEHKIDTPIKEKIIKLNSQHTGSLFELVNLVQPGYFKMKTSSLGDYYGIVEKGKLIAVAGERMKMEDCTEVSAVVTHPDYTGKGYAKQLVAHAVNNILEQDKIPFLHVVENNHAAIKLYETSGFKTRRKISFWNIIGQPDQE